MRVGALPVVAEHRDGRGRVRGVGGRETRCGERVEIGLEEVQDGLWNIVYYNVLLGRFDERTKTLTDAPSLKK